MHEKEKSFTAGDNNLSDIDIKAHHRICDMLQKHEDMWNGRLGLVIVSEQVIDLNKGAKPFKSA